MLMEGVPAHLSTTRSDARSRRAGRHRRARPARLAHERGARRRCRRTSRSTDGPAWPRVLAAAQRMLATRLRHRPRDAAAGVARPPPRDA